MNSEMITATLVTASGIESSTLMVAARALLAKARIQASEIVVSSRAQTARSILMLRATIRKRESARAHRKVNALIAYQQIESERKYRDIVAQAHQDCLEIALTVARTITGELFDFDAAATSARIEAALHRLENSRPLTISVSPKHQEDLKNIFRRQGVTTEIVSDSNVPSGDAIITTALGTVSLSWRDDFEALATQLGTLLAAKITAGTVEDVA